MPRETMKLTAQEGPLEERAERLRAALAAADRVMVGAGSGLSTAAGFVYSGARFRRYFADFELKYGFHDMYSGGFYPFPTLEEQWAYWSRYLYVNRYMDAPKPVYGKLLALLRGKDYFVLTTNVDHCFQKAGFDKERLFYTQGDYGLWQCSVPCHRETYPNGEAVRRMVEAQGYVIAEDGTLGLPESVTPKMAVPSELVPYCPRCGKPMSMNLRADGTFVEDAGWYIAEGRYEAFAQAALKGRTLYLELGVGYNTPGIIKYPFWRWTAGNPQAVYACINTGEALCPQEIQERSICLDGDIGQILDRLGPAGEKEEGAG